MKILENSSHQTIFIVMGQELYFLEDMLFKSTAAEIEERYKEVLSLYAQDPEILNVAKSIKGMCDYILKAYKEIP
ncbi:MAG: hypothetical protein D6699_00905, partial [Aquificota bacterium]